MLVKILVNRHLLLIQYIREEKIMYFISNVFTHDIYLELLWNNYLFLGITSWIGFWTPQTKPVYMFVHQWFGL